MGAELPDYQSYFNSRPHGGRRAPHGRLKKPAIEISTHALTEGDFRLRSEVCTIHISTHALTEGDQEGCSHLRQIHISTHALTEGDGASLSWITEAWYFNSRPHGGRQHPSADGQSDRNFNSRPHGGRHHRSGHDYDRVEFQLTPSRRATNCARGRYL